MWMMTKTSAGFWVSIWATKATGISHELITNVSYDLRSPLTSIIGYVELLRHILYENKVLMEAEGLTLSWELKVQSCLADINTRQMVRVFQNLLDNARRYADRSAPVTVTAQEAGRLHICITNRVADAQDLEPDQMFERFYRGDRARSDARSSGLGLAIVKRIVELHGGEVGASLQGEELSVHLFLR